MATTLPFGGVQQDTVPRKIAIFREKTYKTADRGYGHDARPSAAAMAPMHDRLPRQWPPAPTVTVPFVPFAHLIRKQSSDIKKQPRIKLQFSVESAAISLLRCGFFHENESCAWCGKRYTLELPEVFLASRLGFPANLGGSPAGA